MPLYSYKCESCDNIWDEYNMINDRNLPLTLPCPACNKKQVIRLFSNATYLDKSILDADKNMEKSGVLKELERMKKHHPYMKWNG